MKKIPILMYHNIATPPSGKRLTSLFTSPESFKRQMQTLKWMGYQGLSVKELRPYLRGEKSGKVVGITFDDGYLDNLTNALPVLINCGFSATVYAVSRLLGTTNRWTMGQNIQESPLMQAIDLREWLNCGMSVGSHTRHHVHLCKVSETVALQEIMASKLELEDQMGIGVDDFCYPYGEYNEKIKDFVRLSGYLTAATTARKRVDISDDLLLLPRVTINRRTTLPLFAAKLVTSYEDLRFQRYSYS